MKIRSLILCALLAVTACATSPANRYYVLTPAPAADAALDHARAAPAPQLTVSIPAYLDRAQIILQNDKGEVAIREFDRWAEPVDGMIRRVLLQDMQARAAKPRSVVLTIDSFIFSGDEVTLRAHWTTVSQSTRPPITHQFARTAPASGTVANSVEAMSGLIDALADQIAVTAQ